MKHMSRTRQIGQARLFALLAVLLGLLAMHGIASSHHAAAATPATVVSAQHSLAAAGHGHGHDADPNATAALDVAPRAALSPVAPTPACDDGCPSAIGMLCVAVLTAAAGAAAVLLHRRRQPQPRQPRSSHRARAFVLHCRPFAPPDPVAELCVSRT